MLYARLLYVRLDVGDADLIQGNNIDIRELCLNGKLHRIRITGGVYADGDHRFIKIHRFTGQNLILLAEPCSNLRFTRRVGASTHARQ